MQYFILDRRGNAVTRLPVRRSICCCVRRKNAGDTPIQQALRRLSDIFAQLCADLTSRVALKEEARWLIAILMSVIAITPRLPRAVSIIRSQ
jgi:hypothetical protein